MMRTFDKKNLGKRPPPFSYTPSKNLGRRVCVDRAEHTFCGVSRDFFFLDFKNMSGKGTITISGGNNSLIQKPLKSRNSGYITKLRSKVKEEEEVEEEEGELPTRQPPLVDDDPLPHYPVYLLID